MKTRRGYRRKGKKGQVAKSVKSYVNKVLHKAIEDKEAFVDFADVNPISYTTGTSYLVSHSPSMVQGVGENARIGDQITLKSLSLRISAGTINAIENGLIRVMLVQQKEPQGVIFNIDDLFVNTAGIGIGRVHRQNLDTLRVLYDRTYDVSPQGNISNGQRVRIISIKKKLNTKVFYYTGVGAGSIADVRKNAIYLVLFGSAIAAGGASAVRVMDVQYSITYEDA